MSRSGRNEPRSPQPGAPSARNPRQSSRDSAAAPAATHEEPTAQASRARPSQAVSPTGEHAGGAGTSGTTGSGSQRPMRSVVEQLAYERRKFLNIIEFSPGSFAPRPSDVIKSNYTVISNYLPIRLGKVDKVVQYDVTFNPDVPRKPLIKKLWLAFKKCHPTVAGTIAFDFMKIAYASKPVGPDGEKEINFKIKLEGDKDLPPEKRTGKEWDIIFKPAATVHLNQVQQYAENKKKCDPDVLAAISAMNVILNARYLENLFTFSNRFFNLSDEPTKSLGAGLSLRRGLYMSVRPIDRQIALNYDLAHSVFTEPIPLSDYINDFLYNMNTDLSKIKDIVRNEGSGQFAVLTRLLKRLKVVVSHRPGFKKPYSIFKLHNKVAGETTFEWKTTKDDPNPKTISVADFFKAQYKINVGYDIGIVNVGDSSKPCYLPLSVLKIAEVQKYTGELSERHVSDIIQVAALPPNVYQQTLDRLSSTMIDRSPTNISVGGFGIDISKSSMSVEAAMLQKVNVNYGVIGQRQNQKMDSHVWFDNVSLPFKRPCVINGFGVVIAFDGSREVRGYQNVSTRGGGNSGSSGQIRTLKDAAAYHYGQLIRVMRQRGCDVRELENPVIVDYATPPDSESVEDCAILNSLLKNACNKKRPSFVFGYGRKGPNPYRLFKKVCLHFLGVPSQFIACRPPFRCDRDIDNFYSNVALKLNSKLGGLSWEPALPQFLENKRGLAIMGADVTHPNFGSYSDSIAAVVCSKDSKGLEYTSEIRPQEGRQEIISDMQDVCESLFDRYKSGHESTYPNSVIFYRDGVSEGQFEKVVDVEAKNIREAANKKGIKNFKLTYVVVQKRHHTRFLPDNKSNLQLDKAGCFPPGMVFSKGVTSSQNWDFYLQSQKGLKGTPRPAHYQILIDDIGISANDMASLTFYTCMAYARAAKCVKVPAPVYLSHHACFRYKILSKESDMQKPTNQRLASTAKSMNVKIPDLHENYDPAKRETHYYELRGQLSKTLFFV